MEDHVGMDPFAEPAFWFVLDLALARSHGVTLAGPHARELVGESRPEVVLAAHADAVGWYARNEPGEEAVAAACRAWLWKETGRFAAKADAVAWAAARIAQRDGSR
jgi:thymidylate kinase